MLKIRMPKWLTLSLPFLAAPSHLTLSAFFFLKKKDSGEQARSIICRPGGVSFRRARRYGDPHNGAASGSRRVGGSCRREVCGREWGWACRRIDARNRAARHGGVLRHVRFQHADRHRRDGHGVAEADERGWCGHWRRDAHHRHASRHAGLDGVLP